MNPEKAVECHPLKPFLPPGAYILMLGSFPPKREKWSMDFFYPNFQNDMWRIMGHIFFSDKNHFIDTNPETVAVGLRRFDYPKIVEFCTEKGIALYDTARAVRRLKDNASDKFLEIAEATDISALLARLPECRIIITTGEKATRTLTETMKCGEPKTGACTKFVHNAREYLFYRMPSSSRAYPMSVEKKAAIYSRALLRETSIVSL